MVRPIEITDSLSKVDAVERMQQTQKNNPEATQQFQKSINEKLTVQVTTPNPVPKGDQVVLHVDEQEEEKRKIPEKEEQDAHEHTKHDTHERDQNDEDNTSPHDRIDIKA
ncbi:hypothetical protein ACFL1R_03440 [Candidatus Latescibacterota bacterium]